MDYEFRSLTSKDLFPIFSLIKKIGISEVKKCFAGEDIQALAGKWNKDGDEDGDTALTVVGMSVVFDIADLIISRLGTCEDDIYNILASVSKLKRKELEKMPISEFADMIISFIQKEDFKDFFMVVSKRLLQ